MAAAAPAGTVAAAPIGFAEAAARVATVAPETGAASARLAGAREAARRAGALPDPTLSVESENFGGRQEAGGFDSSELTITARQPLEIGPRMTARRAQAAASTRLSEAEADAAERALLAELAIRYAAADVAGRRLNLAREQAALAARRQQDSARRLQAGVIPEIEEQASRVAEAETQVFLADAHAQSRQARAALARLLALPDAEPDGAWLESLGTRAASAGTRDAADAPLWQARAAVAQAAARAARADGQPTADVMLGVRRSYAADATVGVAGVGLGIPLWNRNRAAIARSRADAEAARLEAEVAARDAADRREAAANAIDAGVARLTAIRTAALPAARRRLELAERGWRAGALPWRDLADATTSQFNTLSAEIDALESIAVARARLWQLDGQAALIGLPPMP